MRPLRRGRLCGVNARRGKGRIVTVTRGRRGRYRWGAMAEKLIYHLCRRADWETAAARGDYRGSGDDLRDGFIHFSTAAEVHDSAARHRAGVPDLLLLAVDPGALGPALKWEAARGGALFPHLYGPLSVRAVARVVPLPLGPDGRHVFPPLD